MRRIWFVSNVRAGTASHETCAAIETVCGERALALAGRTRFPDDPLPDAATLTAAHVDTLMLFAGDGTINAALGVVADWNGAVLILPGGTMNLLARRLHTSLDPQTIIAAAHERTRTVALPLVEAGPHRAFVGMIVGPASAWVVAREAARERRVARALRAVFVAWRRSFGRGVRLEGAPRLRGRYQAVVVTPTDAGLTLAGVDARDWRGVAGLGWNWLTGDWLTARAVDAAHASELRVPRGRPARALIDGEPVSLPPGTTIAAGRSRDVFITTR